MRKTIRSYAAAFSLIAALAVPVSAESTTGDLAGDSLILKTAAVVCYELIKVLIPPG